MPIPSVSRDRPHSPKGKLTLATEDLKKRRARSDTWAVPAKTSAACESVAETSEAVTEQLLSNTEFLSWLWHHSPSSRTGWKLKLTSCISCATACIHLTGTLELLTCCNTTKCKYVIITLLILLYGTNLDCIMEKQLSLYNLQNLQAQATSLQFQTFNSTYKIEGEGCANTGAPLRSWAVWSQHTCSKHDRWIAIVCTADDCSNDNAAVGQLVFISFILNRHNVILLLSCNLKPFNTRLDDKNTC